MWLTSTLAAGSGFAPSIVFTMMVRMMTRRFLAAGVAWLIMDLVTRFRKVQVNT